MADLRCSLSLLALLTACGPEAIVDDDAAGDDEATDTSTSEAEGDSSSTSESDSSESASTDTGDSSDSSTAEPPIDCEQACALLVEGSCYTTQTCLDACSQGVGEPWSPALADAFTSCMAENPLCFMSLEGCMLESMYPEGSEHLVRVSGSGFAEHEGATVYIWHDPEVPPDVSADASIVAGAFAFEWLAAWPVFDGGGPLFLLYIDVDGDALCEPGVDVTASVFTQWNGSFAAPEFEAEVIAPANPADFVCGALP